MFFFFQAEDGIRDYKVTGVQTCALPILSHFARADRVYALHRTSGCVAFEVGNFARKRRSLQSRSEERRVGKEGGSLWSPDEEEKREGGGGVGQRCGRRYCKTCRDVRTEA